MNTFSKIPCTVGILTLNSAKTLERCLLSVQDFAEIIVLDGNSTDGTREIAERFGAHVISQQGATEPNHRITDFSRVHNQLLSLATEPWYFDLDSDEYISNELRKEILGVVTKNEKIAYSISRLAIIDGKIIRHAFFYPDRYIRLYPNKSGVAFHPKKMVHEKLVLPPDFCVRNLVSPIYTPWPTLKESFAKDDQYLGIVYKKSVHQGTGVRKLLFISVVVNILKAAHIFIMAVGIHLRYGTKDVLPMLFTWRFVRYHLLIAKFKLQQLFRFSL